MGWAKDFRAALLELLQRRVRRFGDVIRSELRDFDLRYARLREKLRALDTLPDTALHGDLVPGNVLVDQNLRPLAVLDFGFLTTAGDPRLDAAIAAAVADMYGPHALQITRMMTAQIAAGLQLPGRTRSCYTKPPTPWRPATPSPPMAAMATSPGASDSSPGRDVTTALLG